MPDPHIDAIRGTVAVERGPLVLCLESPDLPAGRHVDEFVVDRSTVPQERDGRVVVHGGLEQPTERPWPYRSDGSRATEGESDAEERERLDVPLTRYHDWADRGPSTMRVWLRTRATPAAEPSPSRTERREGLAPSQCRSRPFVR
ncbi:MAG TPA: hypothetical protein VF129_09605 [Actinomycetota bacterium]